MNIIIVGLASAGFAVLFELAIYLGIKIFKEIDK